jgi:outer membrane immunogenic protein
MKRFTLLACGGLLAAAMAGPSLAADLHPPLKAPVYVAPFSWSGFYVGINGGYAWGTAKMTNVIGSQSFDTNGGLVGGTLGYNLQTGNWVWGLEGDFDASWLKGDDNTAPLCAGGVSCEFKQTWFATARGRIGYAFDRWLPFVTGGLAVGDGKITVPSNNTQTDTRTGWTAGAGLEWAFMGAWSAKIEYLYADLGTKTCAAATCGIATDVEATQNIVRLGVNYRF